MSAATATAGRSSGAPTGTLNLPDDAEISCLKVPFPQVKTVMG